MRTKSLYVLLGKRWLGSKVCAEILLMWMLISRLAWDQGILRLGKAIRLYICKCGNSRSSAYGVDPGIDAGNGGKCARSKRVLECMCRFVY